VVTTTIAWMIAAKNLAFTLSEITKLKLWLSARSCNPARTLGI
jgi:hypothetical protein